MKNKTNELHYYQKKIKIPLYKCYFVILLTNDVEKVKNKWGFEKEHLYAHAFVSEEGYDQVYCTVLNLWAKTSITHGVIAHEALHVTNFIFDDRGVLPSFSNDEPQAYFIEWVCDQIHLFMNSEKVKLYNVQPEQMPEPTDNKLDNIRFNEFQSLQTLCDLNDIDSNRLFKFIFQLISKGNISEEEFRGQLLPIINGE